MKSRMALWGWGGLNLYHAKLLMAAMHRISEENILTGGWH